MYKKKGRRSWNSRAVYVDGKEFPSLFAACIDFEIAYPNAHLKIKQGGGSPCFISGHEIILKDWLVSHPEYKAAKPQGVKK